MSSENYNNQRLHIGEQSIVSIAAFTATGNLDGLKMALHEGLDAGLTVNEIKEVLVQLYAYCGFPRSLNGINTFMSVVEDRRVKGTNDIEGMAAEQVTGTDKYEQGRKTLEELTGMSMNGPLTGANAFAPGIDTFLKEHLFADIFGRGVLSYRQRELATITVLASLPGLGSQLQAHVGMGMNTGLSPTELREAFLIVARQINQSLSDAANEILDKVIATR